MKNYIRQIVELFSRNDYPISVQKRFRHWLADEEHAEEKMETLHSLWKEAGQEKVPQGMNQSIRRMQQNIGMRPVSSTAEIVFIDARLEDIFTRLERKYPYTFVYSSHSLNNNTYSFRFPKQATLDEIMIIVTQVAGDIRYVIRDNKCYITDKE